MSALFKREIDLVSMGDLEMETLFGLLSLTSQIFILLK